MQTAWRISAQAGTEISRAISRISAFLRLTAPPRDNLKSCATSRGRMETAGRRLCWMKTSTSSSETPLRFSSFWIRFRV